MILMHLKHCVVDTMCFDAANNIGMVR